MIIYRFFASWCSSLDCKNELEKIYDLKNNPKYGVKFSITTGDDYTHAIILNTSMPDLKIPKENVVGFAHEPLCFLNLTNMFVNYAIKHIGIYYIGEFPSNCNLPPPFRLNQGFLFRLPLMKNIPKKEKIMSIMVSHKKWTPGHKYRHALVEAILKTDLPIDIIGNGCKLYKHLNDPRVKTEFQPSETNQMYEPYKFHIAIENCTTPEYISEKVLNCFVCNTMPIYWGCKNIKNYVGENILLLSQNQNINEDILLLTNIVNNIDKYYNPIDVNNINELLNIFDFLEKKFMI